MSTSISPHRMRPVALAVLSAGLVAAASAGAFSLDPSTWLKRTSDSEKSTAPAATAPAAPARPAPPAGMVSYRSIVQQAGPAVVGITVAGMHRAGANDGDDDQAPRGGMPPGMENDPFFQFFRGMPGLQGRGRPNPQQPFRGQGSGFIIGSDGLILTNAHVVREAKDVTVKLSDRREYTAKVLGSDPVTDIAVLRIDAKGLPTVKLGDAKSLEVGDPVLAIGAPYGFEQTATQGIVSAKGRSLPGESVVPFIQTDAAVNPGNSGGPLFDGGGSVVGINAQIFSQTGGYQGLSFAIPIDVAMKVKDQIVKTGKAAHGRLGVTVQDLTQGLAESFGLPKPDGALIANVAPGKAAAKAGLKSGDVVTEVDGQPVVRSGELSTLIGLSSPGETVALKVWRDKAWRTVNVKLESIDESPREVAKADTSDSDDARLGLALRPLNRAEQQRAPGVQGLVVENADGPAARAGVEAGDLLVAINGKPVQSMEQVREALAGKPKRIALLVQRDGEQIFVPVSLG
jgi:serine protease Do